MIFKLSHFFQKSFGFTPFLLGFLLLGAPLRAHASIAQLSENTPNDSLRVVTMIERSRELHRDHNHKDEDIELATQAMELAATQPAILYARASNNLGLLYRYHQLYEEAIALHIKAYTLAEPLENYWVDKMTFANNTGVACRYNSQYHLAVDYYMKALNIAEVQDDKRNLEIAGNGLGNTFMAIPGREEEGLAYLEKALEVARSVGNTRGIAIQNLTIGGYYDQFGQHDKARTYLQEVIKINEQNKDAKGMAMGLKAIGESYQAEGRFLDRSQDYFQKALKIFLEIQDKQQQAYTLIRLGELSEGNQRYTHSLNLYKQAQQLGRALEDKQLLQLASKKMADVYEAKGDFSRALSLYKTSRDYQDSINLSNQMVQIAAITRRYDLDKKETEIALLKKEQDLQEIQLEQHADQLESRGIIIILLVALTIALGLVYLLQYKNRKNKRNALALLDQAENSRLKAVYDKNLAEAEILANQMRINPHFLFNCLNSIKNLIQHDKNKLAIKYLVMLARFSRLVLETASTPQHSLQEELDLLTYYIELEKNRFDDRFTYAIDNALGSDADDIYLPSLLLQPFVENAIWHGLLPSNKQEKMLRISVEKQRDQVIVKIDDTGVGRYAASQTQKQHKSRGTEINDKRIALFNQNFPGTIHYEYLDKENAMGEAIGTTVHIHLKITPQYENSHS